MASKITFLLTTSVVVISLTSQLFPWSKETKLSLGYSKSSFLNFTEVTSINQYKSEEHSVITEDGYVLTVFRIVRARNCLHNRKKRPLLLMHGLLQNSDSFLDAGTGAGLPYLLSDECFDVWVGNQRGNNYGRKHLVLNPDTDEEFWQFSVDEIGLYDVPATMDYILKRTGSGMLNYVGYSQGGGVFFAMCSERPDYCKKVAVMIALAPAVILDHLDSILLRSIFRSAVVFKRTLNTLGIQEVFSKVQFVHDFLEYLCQIYDGDVVERFCGSFALLDSYHDGSLTSDTKRKVFTNFPVGTSLNTLARYGQIAVTKKFQKYDYGDKVNMKRYNSTVPPEYNLGLVSTPVVLIQGQNDKLVNIQDTKMLSTKLPNVLEMRVVPDPKWTHFDMMYSRDIRKMIFPKIYEYLNKYA